MSHLASPLGQKIRAVIVVVLPLIGTLAAVVLLWNRYVFWTDLAILAVMYFFLTLGVTIGYHRLLTHDGFQCPSWLRAFFVILGSMSWEGSAITWAATHVKHHAHSDEEDDPHSPLHGFWHAHFGWLFDNESFPDPAVYAPHLVQDKLIVWIDKLYVVWLALSLLIPFALGGWTGLLWGGAVRIFLMTHVTFSVNSICHTFGHRPYQTTDESRNNWVVGLLAFGEGWHNNHHAFPRNAFHGMEWWQFDLSGIVIKALEKLGLAWQVERVSGEVAEAQKTRTEKAHLHYLTLAAQLAAAIKSADDQIQEIFHKVVRDPSLAADETRLREMVAHARRRLDEIRLYIVRASHVKRARLVRYQQEVSDLVASVRGMLTARPAPVAVSA